MAVETVSNVRAKTYEIGYKGFYCEHTEWFTAYMKAIDEKEARRKFVTEHFITRQDIEDGDFDAFKRGESDKLIWWEAEWLMDFRYLKEVNMKPCPLCGGTGKIAVDIEPE